MRLSAVIAAVWLISPGPTIAQTGPAPVPIEEWSIAKISSLGQEIYLQDTAAAVATDALLKHLNGQQPSDLAGWVVVPDGRDQRVRFVRRDGEQISPGWDVIVRDGRAGSVQVVNDGALSESELARFRARQTAAAGIGALRCAPRMNAVVAEDPDSDGWLVWLLTSTTDANVIPVGGHYRFHVSADGRTMVRRDQLSNSCLAMPKNPQGPNGEQAVGVVVNQIVSRAPVETHVFLSLQNRVPIYVSAGDTLFSVEGARIRTVQAKR